MNIPSNKIIQDGIKEIDFQGIGIFKNADNIFDAEIFGIQIKYIVAIAGLIYFLRNK